MKYQIALCSPEGIKPQKYEIYNTEEEAQEIVNKYNSQTDNPWMIWIVIKV